MKKRLTKTKYPSITIDASMDKYQGVVLFPEKLALANSMLEKIGPPKPEDLARRLSKATKQ